MKEADFNLLHDKLSTINLVNENINTAIKNRINAIISSCHFDSLDSQKFYDEIEKKLVLKNLEIHREYSKIIENLNKSSRIAIEKNTNQISLYFEESESIIKDLKTAYDNQRKKLNKLIADEQKSFQRITNDNLLLYDEEIKQINDEIEVIAKRVHIENQKLDQERSKRLKLIEEQYIIDKNTIQSKITELKQEYDVLLDKTNAELDEEVKNKDESYLKIKSTHTQSSIKLNNFINELKKEISFSKENINNTYFDDIDNLSSQVDKIKMVNEQNKEKIQEKYHEKLKALNVVFDVQKDVYNQKMEQIIKRNNEVVSKINQDLRVRKEQLLENIKKLEKNKWDELSKTKDLNEREAINKRFNPNIKVLNDEILRLISHNESELAKQEIIFQTDLFNHDFEHVKQINEWRFSKNYYDMEKKVDLANEKAMYDQALFEIEQQKTVKKTILDFEQEIMDFKLDKKMLPIDLQLSIASFLQNREINLLNIEFEAAKANNALQQKILNFQYRLKELSYLHDLQALDAAYNHESRTINVTYQLEIEKNIIQRDCDIDVLEMNVNLQKSLLVQKNNRYKKILDGTIKRISLELELLNQEYLFNTKTLKKRAQIENQKRSAIMQEISTKNYRTTNIRRNQRQIFMARNEAEAREEINRYYLRYVENFFGTNEEFFRIIIDIVKAPAHPDVVRRSIMLATDYLEISKKVLFEAIDDQIASDKKEFGQRLFALTDYKYRVKHEEIITLYNDSTRDINEQKLELTTKTHNLEKQISEINTKVYQNNLLLKSYRNKKNFVNDANDNQYLIESLEEDNRDLNRILTHNITLKKTIEKQLIAIRNNNERYLKRKNAEEQKLTFEKKQEEQKYQQLFSQHLNIFAEFKENVNELIEEYHKRYRVLSNAPYLSDPDIKKTSESFNTLFVKNAKLLQSYATKSLEFWLFLYQISKNEQTRIINNFNKSTSLALEQGQKAYEKFILVEEKEKELLNYIHQKKIKDLQLELVSTEANTVSDVKTTHNFYNYIYSDTERIIYSKKQKNKHKLQLTAENLDDVIKNLNATYQNKLAQIRKTTDKTKINIMTDIVLLNNEINDNIKRNNIKVNNIIHRYDQQRDDNIAQMRIKNHKIASNIEKLKLAKSNSIKDYQESIIDNLNVTKEIIRENNRSLRNFKIKGRVEQNRLTRRERHVLKKSYIFKKKQINSHKKK